MPAAKFASSIKSSGKDITTTVLLQIIGEAERSGAPLLTADFLAALIRLSGRERDPGLAIDCTQLFAPPWPTAAQRGSALEGEAGRSVERSAASGGVHVSHAQANAALPVDFQHLDAHQVTFAEAVADSLDTLVGDLRDMHQAIPAGQNRDESAEVHEPAPRGPRRYGQPRRRP